jgi:hypothetical protein
MSVGDNRKMDTCRRPGLFCLALAVALLLGAAGCSHVVAYTTPYFVDGPTQPGPPEGDLEAGTWVLVVGSEGSYSRVWTASFLDAYVLSSALRSIWAAPEPPPPEEPVEPAPSSEGFHRPAAEWQP